MDANNRTKSARSKSSTTKKLLPRESSTAQGLACSSGAISRSKSPQFRQQATSSQASGRNRTTEAIGHPSKDYDRTQEACRAGMSRSSRSSCGGQAVDSSSRSSQQSSTARLPRALSSPGRGGSLVETKGLRLLSLDGGGVRGLSSLLILQRLMDRMNAGAEHPRKPCEIFDMIGGTSTGG